MSGSLVYESKTTPNVTIGAVIATLDTLRKTEFSRTTIGRTVCNIEEEHQHELGGYAAFWTKLAICAILAHPKSFKRKISSYLALAEKCPDMTEKLRDDFYDDLHAELKRRCDAEDSKMDNYIRLSYWAPYLHTLRMLGYEH